MKCLMFYFKKIENVYLKTKVYFKNEITFEISLVKKKCSNL